MATEITQRVSAAWRNWKRCSGLLCGRRMPVKLKGKVYKPVVRPALLYGAETWATTRGQEARLEVNEMRMLRWMCCVTRRDNIRNEHIRGTTRVVQLQASKKIREKRLKWYGHVRRMKEEHIVRRMLDVDIPGKRRRGRPNLRWKFACKRAMTQAGLKEDNATNGRMEKEANQLYRRPQMTGQARDEEEEWQDRGKGNHKLDGGR